ncbi:uncharacterized protein L199_004021 [Kwoniella botswanensis]|uniref:uncharacterized protein n=1 Tax=Kwoniella botswanensis TaxID=1268659 RepID=UPI00315C644F
MPQTIHLTIGKDLLQRTHILNPMYHELEAGIELHRTPEVFIKPPKQPRSSDDQSRVLPAGMIPSIESVLERANSNSQTTESSSSRSSPTFLAAERINIVASEYLARTELWDIFQGIYHTKNGQTKSFLVHVTSTCQFPAYRPYNPPDFTGGVERFSCMEVPAVARGEARFYQKYHSGQLDGIIPHYIGLYRVYLP